MTLNEKCFSYVVQDRFVKKHEENHLECFHEEADTRMIFHIAYCKPESKILILVILLGNMHKFEHYEIWLAGNTSKQNEINCFNCSKIAENLGPILCRALPAFHAFTGCDYTAAFFRKGKSRPYQIFKKAAHFQIVFSDLTDPRDIFDDEKMNVVQQFTSLMYGIKKCASVNSARFQLFQKTYCNAKNDNAFLRKVKGFNSNTIPPCWESLKQKVLRTIFVNCMWQNATNATCALWNPTECGWFLDSFLKPTLFEG